MSAASPPTTASNILRNQPDVLPGVDPAGLDRIAELFGDMVQSGEHPAAQLAIYRGGEFVAELAAGAAHTGKRVELDSVLGILSTTKLLTGIVVHMLHDRGVFDYDDPVAKYWPEFANNGKETITIRQVLAHRAGLVKGWAAGYGAWRRWLKPNGVAKLVEGLKPAWVPGEANGYHGLTYGHVFQELAKRWTGDGIGALLRQEICEPLGIADVYIGQPADAEDRFIPFVPAPAQRRIPKIMLPPGGHESFFNSPLIRQSLELPWGNGVARAKDMAHVASIVALRGTLHGRTFLSADTFDLLTTRTSTPGELDRVLKVDAAWGLGVHLGTGPGTLMTRGSILGRTASPRTCGHLGGNSSLTWADPELGLAVAFISTAAAPTARYEQLADTIREACR